MDGTRLRKNPVYYKIYLIYMNLIIHGLIPLLLLAFLNTNVLLSLREAFKVEKKCDNYYTFLRGPGGILGSYHTFYFMLRKMQRKIIITR